MKLIGKDTVVAEIERIKKEECPIDTYEGRCKLLWFERFLSFINTLEVKEEVNTTDAFIKKARKYFIKELPNFRSFMESGTAFIKNFESFIQGE